MKGIEIKVIGMCFAGAYPEYPDTVTLEINGKEYEVDSGDSLIISERALIEIEEE